jgi:hypothetical protein
MDQYNSLECHDLDDLEVSFDDDEDEDENNGPKEHEEWKKSKL